MIKDFLAVGQIVGTHGVRGELRVNPWADSPEFLKQFKTLYYDEKGEKAVKVISARPHGNIVLMKIEGVESVEAASALRNRRLYMRRADAKLKDGVYFIEELIGCEVLDAEIEGKRYGTVCDVSETGANDVWHIRDDAGKEYLIPAVPSVVIETDVEKNRVLISPMKGIFDDEN